VVNWDPRGVGESTPILCSEGSDMFFDADPNTPEGLLAMASAVSLRAEICTQQLPGIHHNRTERDHRVPNDW
jgi:hypothetical protein